MSLSAEVLRGWNQIDALGERWDRLLASCSVGIGGPDVTCSSIWARALARTHLRDADPRFLAVRSGQEIVGLLPTYEVRVTALPVPRRELRIITEAHGGRSGLLLTPDDNAAIDFLLTRLRDELAPWDVVRLSVVEGSTAHSGITDAARRLGFRIRCIAIHESPYVELRPTWEEIFRELPKKMRWTIRKSEKDLRSQGRLEYAELRDSPAARMLLENIYAVERQSWKEQSGTSITAHQQQQLFYEALTEVASQAGILSAHVLRLDGRPIAYILGVAAGDGVFLDLKESFDQSYAEYSPGHVLKRFAFESLIGRGTHTYDFMGQCEPYKMRWTHRTYRCLNLAIYNTTARGSLCFLRSAIRRGSFAPDRIPVKSRPRSSDVSTIAD